MRARSCGHRSLSDKPAFVQQADAVAERLGLVEVMRAQNNRLPGIALPPDEFEDHTVGQHVQAERRLVHDQNRRVGDESARDVGPLLLTG